MLYYIYVLNGPLRGSLIPLTPNHYTVVLYKSNYQESKKDSLKTIIYIPCDKEKEEKTLSITLDEKRGKNNQYTIEQSLNKDEKDKTYDIVLDKPIYLNDIPIFLISDKSTLSFSSFHFKNKKKSLNSIQKFVFSFTIIILLSIFLFSFFVLKNKDTETPPSIQESFNFKGFEGNENYYCVYDKSYPIFEKNSLSKEKIIYINTDKINNLLIDNNKKIVHLILKDQQKPIINFIYHNEHEKIKVINFINNRFTPYCLPIIHAISLPSIIDEMNKLPFAKTTGYKIEEKNNGLIFIFEDILDKENKIIIDDYIKKQTTLFGRKFIFYRENMSNPTLKNKAILQEDNGYIFLDSQHRYFPKG